MGYKRRPAFRFDLLPTRQLDALCRAHARVEHALGGAPEPAFPSRWDPRVGMLVAELLEDAEREELDGHDANAKAARDVAKAIIHLYHRE